MVSRRRSTRAALVVNAVAAQFEVLRKVDKAHEEGIWSVAWRRNNIVTGSADGKVKCWNEQLEKRFEYDASPLGVVSVDVETFGARK